MGKALSSFVLLWSIFIMLFVMFNYLRGVHSKRLLKTIFFAGLAAILATVVLIIIVQL